MVNGIVSLISLYVFSFLVYVLAIFNSAAMNIGVHVSSSIMVSSGYMGFPGGINGKGYACNVGDLSSITGSG